MPVPLVTRGELPAVAVRRRGLLLGALAALVLLGSAAPAQADDVRIIAEERVDPRVIELTISTPAFTEPTKVAVNLPVGYEQRRGRRWPVTYFLAGTMNTYRTFNSLVDGVELTESFPAIVVSPNGDSGYWSDWYNGGAFGPPMYETYVIDQLIPLIDARFRTVADRSQRAVMGTSMGGYGAMMVAARRPDLFAAAASVSGAVDSNLPAHGAVLSASPTFQGAEFDAIYGPRSTQEVRWRGHNPTDLAANLRDMDLQVRSANGVLNPAIGEDPASADSASCVVEAGVYMASVSLHDRLATLGIPHLWQDYGAGCHSVPNFKREIADTLGVLARVFERPPEPPRRFDHASIEPDFEVWGWRVRAQAERALEFLWLRDVGRRGLTAVGSGTVTITTPPMFRGLRRVDLDNAAAPTAVPGPHGRIRFAVDLGAPNADQQYTAGATTAQTARTVSFRPLARIKIARPHPTRGDVRICARSVGGTVAARVQVVGADRVPLTHRATWNLAADAECRALDWTRRPDGGRATVRIVGEDRFAHRVDASRAVRLPRRGR